MSRLLLKLYPKAFRERYGDELVGTIERDRARPQFAGRWGALRFWTYTVADAVVTAIGEWRSQLPSFRLEVDVFSMMTDLKFTLRSLWGNSRLTLMAALTLALGIGASTVILSVTKGVLLDPLPYRDSDRLTLIWSEMADANFTKYPISGPELNDLRTRTTLFEEFGSIWTTAGALVENDEPETVRVGLVTWNFPSILSAEPVIGRLFEPSDEGTRSDSIIISDALWQRRFGGEPSALGKRVRIDGGWGFPGGTFTIVGVLPPSFRLVMPADSGVSTRLDVLVPFANDLKAAPRGLYYLRTVGRIRSDATVAQARAEVRAIGEQIRSEFPEYDASGRGFNAVSLKGDAVARARPVILALLVGTGFLLLITCANVANLLLSRAAARHDEILVRTALGASGRQITAQLLMESLALAILGGVGGLILGSWALTPLLALAPGSLPRPDAITADPLVLGIAFGTSLVCGLLFGVAPVVTARKHQLYSALRSGTRTTGVRARNVLVAAELALAFVLTVGATLCYRTLEQLERVELGFQSDNVLTMELTLPRQRYGDGVSLAAFTRELDRRLADVSGVVAAGAINQLPLSDLPNWSSPYRTRSVEASEGETQEADGRVITPGYFNAVRAHLIDGRFFDDADDEQSRHVVIVDELLAERAWPGERAVGQEIEVQVRKDPGFVTVWADVVGVIEHTRHHDPRFDVREQFFVPFSQGARNQMGVAVLARGDPIALIAPIEAELAAMDKDLAVTNIKLLDDYTRDARAVQRLTMVLAAGFAIMALVLGFLGLYGVAAYAVTSRSREIGLRMALGASAAGVIGWVLRQGVVVVIAGIGGGLVGALAIGQLLEGLLFGVAPRDPLTLIIVPVLLALVTLVASWLPARRATRIDPAIVLRQD